MEEAGGLSDSEPEGADAGALDAADHGGLVRKILETKAELESGLGEERGGSGKRATVYDEKERERTAKEATKLQGLVQGLTKTAHPLGSDSSVSSPLFFHRLLGPSPTPPSPLPSSDDRAWWQGASWTSSKKTWTACSRSWRAGEGRPAPTPSSSLASAFTPFLAFPPLARRRGRQASGEGGGARVLEAKLGEAEAAVKGQREANAALKAAILSEQAKLASLVSAHAR